MSNVINWFEIPVAQMDRAIAFYEPVMQVSLRRENMDCAELAVFPHQDPAPGGALLSCRPRPVAGSREGEVGRIGRDGSWRGERLLQPVMENPR